MKITLLHSMAVYHPSVEYFHSVFRTVFTQYDLCVLLEIIHSFLKTFTVSIITIKHHEREVINKQTL